VTSLLPAELHFLVDGIGRDERDVCAELDALQARLTRDVQEEIRYIRNPPDPDRRPKLVQYVFEKRDDEPTRNQHSA